MFSARHCSLPRPCPMLPRVPRLEFKWLEMEDTKLDGRDDDMREVHGVGPGVAE